MSHFSLLMVNHNIMRFDIPVHNAFAMAEVQRFQQLIDVEANIIVNEPRI
jgi:hypothetical protein